MEQLNELLKFIFSRKNYTIIVIFFATIFCAIMATQKFILPKYHNWRSEVEALKQQQSEYDSLLQQKQRRIQEEKNNLVRYDEVPTRIFKTMSPDLPVESASIEFVTNILKMIQTTKNTVIDISYKIDTLSEQEKNNIPSNVSVVQLNMTLNGTYVALLNFISSLYDYNYLATIKQLKSTPLKENKNILETHIELWLYVSK